MDHFEAVDATSTASESVSRPSVMDRLKSAMRLVPFMAAGVLNLSAAQTGDAANPVIGKAAAKPVATDKAGLGSVTLISVSDEKTVAPLNAPNLKVIQKDDEIRCEKGGRPNMVVIPPVVLSSSDAPHLQPGLIEPKGWVVQKVKLKVRLDAVASIQSHTLMKDVATRWALPGLADSDDVRVLFQTVDTVLPKTPVLPNTRLNFHTNPTITEGPEEAAHPRGLAVLLSTIAVYRNAHPSKPLSIPYDLTVEQVFYRAVPIQEADIDELKEKNPEFKSMTEAAASVTKLLGKPQKKEEHLYGKKWVQKMMEEQEGNKDLRIVTGLVLLEPGRQYMGYFCMWKGIAFTPDGVMLKQSNIFIFNQGMEAPVLMEGKFPTKWSEEHGFPFDAQVSPRVQAAQQGEAKDPYKVIGTKIDKPEVSTMKISPEALKGTGIDLKAFEYVATERVREMMHRNKDVKVAGGNDGNAANK